MKGLFTLRTFARNLMRGKSPKIRTRSLRLLNRRFSIDIWQLKCQHWQTNKLTNKTNKRHHFRDRNINNVVVYQLSNEYWVSWIVIIIMCEYLKYCIKLFEYWLKKSSYMNRVLVSISKRKSLKRSLTNKRHYFRDQNKNNVVVYQMSNEYWVSWIAYILCLNT